MLKHWRKFSDAFFVTTSFIFFEWKIVFYNLIWSLKPRLRLSFFHLCFAIASIVFTQRWRQWRTSLFTRKFDSITWQTHLHTQKKTHFEDRLNRLSFIVIVHTSQIRYEQMENTKSILSFVYRQFEKEARKKNEILNKSDYAGRWQSMDKWR